LKQRVLTAALLIPPVLLAVFLSNPWPFAFLGLIALFIAYPEVERLAGIERSSVIPILGTVTFAVIPLGNLFNYFATGGSIVSWELDRIHIGIMLSAWTIGALAARAVAIGTRGRWFAELSSLWLAAGLGALVFLKTSATSDGLWIWDTPVLLALVPLWIGDTAAIFAGRAFGKHLLAPNISPKKTVEGGIANLLGCIGGAIGLTYLIHQPLLVGVLVGIATGVLGQVGDLLESAMKRSAGVKDSGNLLPGHGGLLDRIDSILLSAPAVALIVVTLAVR
jgi:phosphatidate cytidylyltransferase